MSLIDTACVGQLGVTSLAALGPNVSIFNFVFQAFTFLGAATCNILAGYGDKDHQEALRTLSHALLLALGCGVGVMAVLLCFGPLLLSLMGSEGSVGVEALSYLRIRALSAPAVMVMVASAGACLGRQDSVTPLAVYGVAAGINLVGDYFLTLRGGWWGTLSIAPAFFI